MTTSVPAQTIPGCTADTQPKAAGRQQLRDPRKARISGFLRHPTAANNLTMERFERAGEGLSEESGPSMDMIRQRPCTPNDQYSCMNEQQIKRIKDFSRPGPVFRHDKPHWIPDKRYYMDRYATSTNQHLLREQPRTEPPRWCWLDEQWQREPPEQHDTSRPGASLPWGPPRTGSKTYSHFDGEDVYRYLNIDVYCRPPSNVMERVVHKFGRAPSYYHQRKPNTLTWFGSSHELNRTDVLMGIRPKSQDDYEVKWRMERLPLIDRKGKWPEFSEYTDRFTLRSGIPPILNGLERCKMHVAEAEAKQSEA